MSVLEEFKKQWEIPREEFDQVWLDKTVSLAESLILEMGSIGQEFNAAVYGLAIPERLATELDERWGAALSGYVFGSGYHPVIEYGGAALRSPYDFVSSRFHEYIHAMQMENAPITHAVPSNPVGKVVLLPSSYVKVRELMEVDAYTKQGWLMHEFTKAHDLEKPGADTDSIYNVEAFYNDVTERLTSETTWSKLATTGATLLHKLTIPTEDGGDKPFFRDYHTQFLDQYMLSLQRWNERHPDRQAPDGFRLMGADMVSVGSSFGPNIFEQPGKQGMLSVFGSPSQLMPENQAKLQATLYAMGIEDEFVPDLKGFVDTLADLGETPHSFMEQSKAGIAGLSGGGRLRIPLGKGGLPHP